MKFTESGRDRKVSFFAEAAISHVFKWLLGEIAFCNTFLRNVVCLSACAVPEMTYTVSNGTLNINPTHSLTHSVCVSCSWFLLKLLDEFRCDLANTPVGGSNVTLCYIIIIIIIYSSNDSWHTQLLSTQSSNVKNMQTFTKNVHCVCGK